MRSLYIFVAFVVGLLFLASISVNAAMQGHLNLPGQKQGEIKGQNVQGKTKTPKSSKGKPETITVNPGSNMQKQ